MAVKSADGDDMDIVGTTNTLKAAQEENWTYLEYVDDNVLFPNKYNHPLAILVAKTRCI